MNLDTSRSQSTHGRVVIVAGAAGVGKTLLIRAIQSCLGRVPGFPNIDEGTVVEIPMASGGVLMSTIYELPVAAQSKFQIPETVPRPDIVVVCFSATASSSYVIASEILDNLKSANVNSILLALKIDGIRKITTSAGEALAEKFAVPYLELSVINSRDIQRLSSQLSVGGLLNSMICRASAAPSAPLDFPPEKLPDEQVKTPIPPIRTKLQVKSQPRERYKTIVENTDETASTIDSQRTIMPSLITKTVVVEPIDFVVVNSRNIYDFQDGMAPGKEHCPFREIYGNASAEKLSDILNMKKVQLVVRHHINERQMRSTGKHRDTLGGHADKPEFLEIDDILGSYSDESASPQSPKAQTIFGKPTRKLTNGASLPFQANAFYSLRELIAMCTGEANDSWELSKSVIFGFRKFFEPRELIDTLIARFTEFYTAESAEEGAGAAIHMVQVRVINIFQFWISNFFDADFNPDVSNGKTIPEMDIPTRFLPSGTIQEQETGSTLFALLTFLEILVARGAVYRTLSQKLMETLWNQQMRKNHIRKDLLSRNHSVVHIPKDFLRRERTDHSREYSSFIPSDQISWPYLPNSSRDDVVAMSFLEWFMGIEPINSIETGTSPNDIALILTQLSLEHFIKVQPREWLNYASCINASDERRFRNSPNVSLMIANGKLITQWIKCTILAFTNLNHRALCIGKFIETAWILWHEFRNYHAAASIVLAISSQPISNLASSFLYLQKMSARTNSAKSKRAHARNYTLSEKLELLQREFDYSTGFQNHRETLRKNQSSMHSVTLDQKSEPLLVSLGSTIIKSFNSIAGAVNERKKSNVSLSQGLRSRTTSSSSVSLRPLSMMSMLTRKPSAQMQSPLNEKGRASTATSDKSINQTKSSETLPQPATLESQSLSLKAISIAALQNIADESNILADLVIPYAKLIVDDLLKIDDSLPDFMMLQQQPTDAEIRPINWKKFTHMRDIVQEAEKMQNDCIKALDEVPSFMEPIDESHPVSFRDWICGQPLIMPEIIEERAKGLEQFTTAPSTQL